MCLLIWDCLFRDQVNTVRDAIKSSGVTNEQICLVLQYYENDIDKTIAAYLEGSTLIPFVYKATLLRFSVASRGSKIGDHKGVPKQSSVHIHF